VKKSSLRVTLAHALVSTTKILPFDISEWVQAMLSEADQAHGAGEFVSWIYGMLTTVCRLLFIRTLRSVAATRPLAAICSALYFGAFSAFVITHLSFEIGSSQIPLLWGHAWTSVCRCIGLALAAIATALALYLRRNFGRHMATVFAGIQIAMMIAGEHFGETVLLNSLGLLANVAIILLVNSRCMKAVHGGLPRDSDPDPEYPIFRAR
jgi:hypothetical protein